MSSRRSESEACSSGASACSSCTKSPSSDSSSSPIGFSSETGSCDMRRISRTSSVVISSSSAISSGLGSRPRRCTSWRSMCTTLFSFSTMWTGMRIVRALSAIARVTACRIHHVAQVELRSLLLFRYGELFVGRMLVRLALHQLDPVIDEVRVEVLDLLLRELDVLEPGCDLVVVENALLETFLDELLKLLDLRKGDVDGEQRRLTSRLSRVGGRGLDLPLARERAGA